MLDRDEVKRRITAEVMFNDDNQFLTLNQGVALIERLTDEAMAKERAGVGNVIVSVAELAAWRNSIQNGNLLSNCKELIAKINAKIAEAG